MKMFIESAMPLASLAGAVWINLIVILLLRHPRRPRWSDSEGFDQGVAIVLVAAYCAALTLAGEGLTHAGMSVITTASIIVATFTISILLPAALFQIPRRLRMADRGLSPFGTLPRAGEPRLHGGLQA